MVSPYPRIDAIGFAGPYESLCVSLTPYPAIFFEHQQCAPRRVRGIERGPSAPVHIPHGEESILTFPALCQSFAQSDCRVMLWPRLCGVHAVCMSLQIVAPVTG